MKKKDIKNYTEGLHYITDDILSDVKYLKARRHIVKALPKIVKEIAAGDVDFRNYIEAQERLYHSNHDRDSQLPIGAKKIGGIVIIYGDPNFRNLLETIILRLIEKGRIEDEDLPFLIFAILPKIRFINGKNKLVSAIAIEVVNFQAVRDWHSLLPNAYKSYISEELLKSYLKTDGFTFGKKEFKAAVEILANKYELIEAVKDPNSGETRYRISSLYRNYKKK
jgi:hypothetical protein